MAVIKLCKGLVPHVLSGLNVAVNSLVRQVWNEVKRRQPVATVPAFARGLAACHDKMSPSAW